MNFSNVYKQFNESVITPGPDEFYILKDFEGNEIKAFKTLDGVKKFLSKRWDNLQPLELYDILDILNIQYDYDPENDDDFEKVQKLKNENVDNYINYCINSDNPDDEVFPYTLDILGFDD